MFNKGDVVRLKGEIMPMTVCWDELEYGAETVCCIYLEGKEQKYLKVAPETLELVPKKALIRLNKKQNQSGLKYFIENHPVIIYTGIAIIAFLGGLGLQKKILDNTNQEIITKGTYISLDEFNTKINSEYVSLKEYNQMQEENEELKDIVKTIENKEVNIILEKITTLEGKRNILKSKLKSVRLNSNSLTSSPEGPKEVTKEELEIIQEIENIDSEILVLYKKL